MPSLYWKILVPIVAVLLIVLVSSRNESNIFGSHTELSVENHACIGSSVSITLRNTGTEYISTEDMVIEKDGMQVDYMWDRVDLFQMENIVFQDTCDNTACDYTFSVLVERKIPVTSLHLKEFCN